MKSRMSKFLRKTAPFLAIVGAALWQSVGAQELNYAPDSKVTFEDDAGVDLISGRPIRSFGNLSLGDLQSPAVDFTIFSTSNSVAGRTPLFANYEMQCTTYGPVSGCIYYRYQWNIAGEAEFYSFPQYPPSGSPAQVTQQGSQFSGTTLYRRKDGSVWQFNAGTGRVSSATYPDGTVLTYNYGTTTGGSTTSQLRSIVNNRGYMMHFEGFSQYQGSIPTKVTLINLNVDYCAPTATTCTGLTRVWPSVTYRTSTVNGVTTLTATDHLGRVATRTSSVSPTVIEGDWNKWTATYRYTSPGGVWFEFQNDVKSSRLPSGVSGVPCKMFGLIGWLKNPAGQWNYSWNASHQCMSVNIESVTSAAPDGTSRRYVPLEGLYDELNRKSDIGFYSFQDFYGVTIAGIKHKVFPEGNRIDYLFDDRMNHRESVITSKSGSTISASASYPTTCSLTTYKTCNKPDYTIDANGNRTDYTYYPHGGTNTITRPPDKVGPNGVRPQIRNTYVQKSARYKTSASGYAYGSAIQVLDTTKTCKTGATCAGTDQEVVTSYTYNDNLLPETITVRDGTGALLSNVARYYDAFGNATSIDGSEPGSADTHYYFFDGARREIGDIGPDPDGAGPLLRPARRKSYSLDNFLTREEFGTATATTLAALQAMAVISYIDSAYDGLARLTRQTAVGGGTIQTITQFSYDSRSRVQCSAVRMNRAVYSALPESACDHSTVGPHGPDRITRNIYDAAGQLVQVVQGDGTAHRRAYVTRTYTGNGKVQDTVDANGNRSRQTFDSFDRPSDFFYPSPTRPAAFDSSSVAQALSTAGSHNPGDFEHLEHDNKGNVTSWKRRDNTTIGYELDPLDRLVVKNLPNGTAQDVYTGYDLLDNVLYRRFDSHTGSGVSYTYDGVGRVKSATDMNGRTIGYELTASSVRKRLTFPGGDYVGSTYDGLGRLTDLGWNSDAGLIGRTYDAQGNLTKVTKGTGETRFTYDDIGNLTSHTNDLAGTENDIKWSFTEINPALQIQAREASSTRFDFKPVAASSSQTHDGLNRLSSIVALPGGYDARHNLATDGVRTFGFDLENRLLTATGGGANLTLTYDPEGRIARYSVGGTHTHFLYDGDALIAEYDSAGNLLRRYVHGPGADSPMVWFEGPGSGDARYLYTNRQGSIVASANSAGGLLGLYKYGPYGEPRDANDAEYWAGPRFRYTGQIALPEAKLYHYKARVYDPAIGRFLQTDPIGAADDQNLYAYVGGDLINATDPTGTWGFLLSSGPWYQVGIFRMQALPKGFKLNPVVQGVRTGMQQMAKASGETAKAAARANPPKPRPPTPAEEFLKRLEKLNKEELQKFTTNRGPEESLGGGVRYLDRLDFFNKFGDWAQFFWIDAPMILITAPALGSSVTVVPVDDSNNEIPQNETTPEDPWNGQPSFDEFFDWCTMEEQMGRSCEA